MKLRFQIVLDLFYLIRSKFVLKLFHSLGVSNCIARFDKHLGE